MKTYPEIAALKSWSEKHQVKVLVPTIKETFEDLQLIHLQLAGTSYPIYTEDEYNDLSISSPLLHMVVALGELELIEESTDYLNWCNILGVSASHEKLRQYYQTWVKQLPSLKKYFPNKDINSFISDLDFQLNAGAAQLLRSS